MATNDLTIIRLYADEPGKLPAVSTGEFSHLTEQIVKGAASAFRVHPINLRLHYALSPRFGCLEFCFDVVVNLDPSKLALVAAAGAVALVPTVDLMWRVIFGERGLVDLVWHRRETAPLVPELEADDPYKQRELVLKAKLLPEMLKDQATIAGVESILQAASAFNATVTRVTIQVPDHPEIRLSPLGRPDARLQIPPHTKAGDFDRVTSAVRASFGSESGLLARATLVRHDLVTEEANVLLLLGTSQPFPQRGSLQIISGPHESARKSRRAVPTVKWVKAKPLWWRPEMPLYVATLRR